MIWHTIKSERYNMRANGQFACYPVYSHETGERVGTLCDYAENVNHVLKVADKQGDWSGLPIYPYGV
jgi:hypothetical protein